MRVPFLSLSLSLSIRLFQTLIGREKISLSLSISTRLSRFFPRRQDRKYVRTCKVEGYRMTSAHAIATLYYLAKERMTTTITTFFYPPNFIFFLSFFLPFLLSLRSNRFVYYTWKEAKDRWSILNFVRETWASREQRVWTYGKRSTRYIRICSSNDVENTAP